MKYLALLSGMVRLALLPTLRDGSYSLTLLSHHFVWRRKSRMTILLVVTIAVGSFSGKAMFRGDNQEGLA